MKTVEKRESVTSMTLVPKIVLYDHDDIDGKENSGKRKKSKKPHKVSFVVFNSAHYRNAVMFKETKCCISFFFLNKVALH